MTKSINVQYARKAQEQFAYSHTVNAVRHEGNTVTRHHMNPLINWLLSLIKGC